MIPTTSKHVNIELLHPEFKRRLEAFFKDSRIRNKVKVVSGVRTYAQQKDLYRRYKAGTFPNLVANPDRKFGGGFQGSWHMQQPNHPEGAYGFAVDFRIVGRITTGTINKVAREYGLWKTVPSEWWHHQAYGYDGRKYTWFPAPALEGKREAKAQVGASVMAQVDQRSAFEYIADAMKSVIRKGAKGPVVEILQSRLANKGYRLTKYPSRNTGIDGHFGWYTLRALKQFQKKSGLVADGICGPKTWKALMK